MSKGVAFLFNEHADLKILSNEIYEDGRIISLTLEISNQNLQIINIYAPNAPAERKRFIKKINEKIDETFVQVIAGDFNCVMNCSVDRNPPSTNRDQGQAEMEELIKQSNLEDLFRKRFPTERIYTFSRGLSKSRIDMFLTSRLLDSAINTISI